MQRVGHLGVRSAVVTVLAALLLVCTASFAQALPAPHVAPDSGDATQAAGVHQRSGPGSATRPGAVGVVRPHRVSRTPLLDGAAPGPLPERVGPPRPSYVAVRRSAGAGRPHLTTRTTADGRAPPA